MSKSIPSTEEERDLEHSKLLIAMSKARYKSIPDEYRAFWLLEGTLGSRIWRTVSPNGKSLVIDFAHPLPNGTLLSDPENSKLLTTIQKWAYHLRRGEITDFPLATNRWLYNIMLMENVSSWLVLHEDIYQTQKMGFKLFDIDAFKSLASELASGGIGGALQYKERVISHFHSLLKYDCDLNGLIETPFDLPKPFVDEAITYLKTNKLYTRTKVTNRPPLHVVSRSYLSEILSVKFSATSSDDGFRLFVRQFEPELYHPHLLISNFSKTCYPSQNTLLLTDARTKSVSAGNFIDQVDLISSFYKGSQLIPAEIPEVEINKKELISEYAAILRPPSHTPLIPLGIGLLAINKACEWILNYGSCIVEATISFSQACKDIDSRYQSSTASYQKSKWYNANKDTWLLSDMEETAGVPLINIFDIDTYQPAIRQGIHNGINNFRSVIFGFVGACAILIAMMKPIRMSELANLNRMCLGGEENGEGSFLNHRQGKSGNIGESSYVSRPIPWIVARAVQLLQLMGSQLSAIFDDMSDHSRDLFYIPARGFTRSNSESLEGTLDDCINTFCDFIETPVDTKGRRWYIRVHEMRKFFLLIMHRHEGEQVKPLLGYAAAHTDDSHTDEYTAPHEEYDEYILYESECIEDKLINLESGKVSPGNDGLQALYRYALHYFEVTSISAIREQDYHALLSELRACGVFEVTTYTILLTDYNDNVTGIDFAIRFGESRDEKFSKG